MIQTVMTNCESFYPGKRQKRNMRHSHLLGYNLCNYIITQNVTMTGVKRDRIQKSDPEKQTESEPHHPLHQSEIQSSAIWVGIREHRWILRLYCGNERRTVFNSSFDDMQACQLGFDRHYGCGHDGMEHSYQVIIESPVLEGGRKGNI